MSYATHKPLSQTFYPLRLGVEHVTDAALGVAIFTVFFLAGWAIYLTIDMLLLFKKSARAKAMVNIYLLMSLTIGVVALLVNLYT